MNMFYFYLRTHVYWCHRDSCMGGSSVGVTRSRGMAQFGPGLLLPEGSHPAAGDLKPGVPSILIKMSARFSAHF